MAEDSTSDAGSSLLHELSRVVATSRSRELPILLREAVHLVWRAAPQETAVIVSVNAATGMLTAVQLGLTQRLLQAVLQVQNGSAVSSVIPELSAFVVVLTILGILTLYQSEKKRVLAELVTQYSQVLVATAAAEADLIEFERPSFHDRLQRTMANATSRPVEVTYTLMGIVTAAFTVAGVTVALAIVQPILLVLALVAFGPVLLVARRLSRISFAFDVEETEADRRRHYLLAAVDEAARQRAARLSTRRVLHRLSRPALERAHRTASALHAAPDQTRHRGPARQWRAVRIGGRTPRLAAVDRAHNVSDAAVAAGAILLLGQRMSSLIGNGGQLYEAALFLADVQDFLDGGDGTSATHADRPRGRRAHHASAR